MRAIVQRVRDARVVVRNRVTGSISAGLLVYLAVRADDTESDADWIARKVSDLRVFPDEHGKMNRSLCDLRAQARAAGDEEPGLLVVSQFTLYGDVRKGRRPSYNDAAAPEAAFRLYRRFLEKLAELSVPPESGVFREHMDVTYTNDGPVTILIDSPR